MKKILIPIVALLLVGSSCVPRPEWIYPPRQYHPGQKVLLKTGHVAVILEHPMWGNAKYQKGEQPVSPIYRVRVGFGETKNKDWLGDTHTIQTGTFQIREYEIEKKIE